MMKKTDMKIVYAGDPRVRVILGKQTEPEPGGRIRPCRYVVSEYYEGQCLLFHTLTRRMILMPPAYLQYGIAGTYYPAEILSNPVIRELYRHYFLVSDDFEEATIYQQIKEILRLKEELPTGISNYVILPTTACNARCFYCFEQGMHFQNMSREIEEYTTKYILDHLPETRKLHIHWFGGEPLLGAEIIDRITRRLLEEKVELQAEMTTNGSLFTDDLVKKAKTFWNVKTVQITLDGRKDEYIRRKQYLPSVKNPYKTVISHIHSLLEAGIEVKIRLNLDKNNVGELFLCVDELTKEFPPGTEREGLSVYCHSLIGCAGCGSDGDLEQYVRQIEDYIDRSGLGGIKDISPFLKLRTAYCMADRAEVTAVISSDGCLYTCEGMPKNLHYGDVRNGIIDQAYYESITKPRTLLETCMRCRYLPECTDFTFCPNREEYPRCWNHMKKNNNESIRNLYKIYLERKREKEGPDVSD